MVFHDKCEPTVKKTRRGKGGKQAINTIDKRQTFSLLGTNANGLKAKTISLKNTIKHFNGPSAITIQETKLRHNGLVKLEGYQIFELAWEEVSSQQLKTI